MSKSNELRGVNVNMRGDVISPEYQGVVFVRDDEGGEYVCYAKDLSNRYHVTDDEKENCIDTSLVLGPKW
jgi:hypothetical protein